MTLNLVNDFLEGLNNIFTQFESFIENHFDNPLLWILIIVFILIIVSLAYHTLSK